MGKTKGKGKGKGRGKSKGKARNRTPEDTPEAALAKALAGRAGTPVVAALGRLPAYVPPSSTINALANEGNFRVLEPLLDRLAELTVQGKRPSPLTGETLANVARFVAMEGDQSLLESLIGAAAAPPDPSLQDVDSTPPLPPLWEVVCGDAGDTMLHLAFRNKRKRMAAALLEATGPVGASQVNADGETVLHVAAGKGKRGLVQLAIKHGADVNALDATGATPLAHAAVCVSTKAINALLAAGADPNLSGSGSKTPLAIAAGKYHLSVVRALLAGGSEPSELSPEIGVAVTFAAMLSDDDVIVKRLVGEDASLPSVVSVNARDSSGVTLLFAAVQSGRLDPVEWLLARGADVNVQDSYGCTPAIVAAGAGRIDMVRVLADAGACLATANHAGMTCLWAAAGLGHVAVVEEVVTRAPETLEIRTERQTTALWIAAAHGHVEVVNYLVSVGASIEVTDVDGQSAIDVSVGNRRFGVFRSFIESEFDMRPYITTEILIELARGDQYKIVRHLATSGIDLDAADGNGINALLAASSSGNYRFVRALLAYGANVNHRDVTGRNAVIHAVETNELRCVRLLRINGGDPMCLSAGGTRMLALHRAAELGFYDIVAELASDPKIDVNGLDPWGNTALAIAVVRSKVRVVSALIAAGANMDAALPTGESPLMVAVEEGDLRMMKRLLLSGANVNMVDASGRTPFFKAALIALSEAVHNGNVATDPRVAGALQSTIRTRKATGTAILQLLVDHGADVNKADFQGLTVFSMVTAIGVPSLLEMLYDMGCRPTVDSGFVTQQS